MRTCFLAIYIETVEKIDIQYLFFFFLRFKHCREQQIFWISLSGRSPEMVQLPGKGVSMSQEPVPLPYRQV